MDYNRKIRCLWVSSKRATFRVDVRDNIIISAAPIARKFIGQPLDNLKRFFGIDRIEELL